MPPLDPYEGLGTPVDPYEGLGTPEPTSNYFADKARRFARDGIKGIGQLVASPGTALQSIAQVDADLDDWLARKLPGGPTDAEIAAQRAKMDALMQLQTPMLAAQALRNVGADVGKAFPQIGPADPARDREVGSAVASGAGSLVPLLATGGMGTPAQVLAGGGLMGQQQREDAERSGATPSQQAVSFGLGGATGLASEALLGLPAMLRSVRGAKIVPQAMASAEAGVDKLVASQLGNLGQMVPMLAKAAPTVVPIVQQAVKTAAREGVQEGIEQIAQNTIAKDAVGYDPTRDRTEGLGMAMLAGSIVGGGLGAGTQALAGLDTRKNLAETAATLAAQQEQLLAGRRAAQMFPVDAQGNVTNELPLPEGMRRLETERGVFHYNPQQITADEIFSASAKGAENRALNLGSTSKPEAEAAAAQNNEPLVTITERTPDGTEVRSAVINQSAAEKTMAEMQAGLTPGNSLVVETPEKTLAGRAPDFLADILNRDAQALAARQAADAKEKTAREQRQRDLDAKKENVGEAMQQGDAVLQDSAATFADVQGALKRVQFYAENNALGITQDQRIAAQRQQAKLAQRLAALEPAEMARRDLENQKRLADDAAALAAQKAQRTQAKQEFKQEVTAGRDATGALDYTRMAEADLETRAVAGDKKAEREMMARNDRAGDDRPTLLDVLARVKLPANDAALGRELRLLTEGMTVQQRRQLIATKEEGLDSVAEVLRADHGFSQIQTPADVIDFVERALRGEDIRPDRTGEGQVEFATNKAATPASPADPAPRTDFRDAEEQRAYLRNPDNFNDRPYPGVVEGTPLWNANQALAKKSLELDAERRRRKLSFDEIETIAQRATGRSWPDFQDVADYDRTLAELRNPGSQVGKFPGGQTEIEFATIQDTFDLGGTPVGIDLPNQVRNLAPRWQDKTLAFESSLDKALYYAGGTNSETRDLVAARLAQQTGLTPGQIATLARQLRTRIEPLTRSAATTGTIRVPAQMRSEVAQLTGAEFAAKRINPTSRNITAETLRAPVQPVALDPAANFDRPNTENRAGIIPQLRAQADQPIVNTQSGDTITFTRSQIPHLTHDAKGPDGFRALAKIRELIASAVRITTEQENSGRLNVREVQRYIAAIDDGETVRPVRITVHKTAEGTRLHSLNVMPKKERHPGNMRGLASAHLASSRVTSPMTVEDLLPGVKMESDGTASAQFAADTKPAPAPEPTDNATIERELTALLRAFPRLAVLFKLRIGSIRQEFDKAAGEAGYKGQIPSNVEAAVWGQKRLIVIAARAWRDRNNGAALVTHEVAHLFWDTLPTAAKTQLRALHAKETGTKTGPLYTAQGFMRGSIQFERDRLPVARVAADPDLPVKEWFAERIAIINKAWAEGRLDRTEASLLRRLAFELRQLWRRIVEAFAIRSNIDPDSELFEAQFRAFILAGADVQIGRNAGTSYAQKKAQFATRPDFATGERPAVPAWPDNFPNVVVMTTVPNLYAQGGYQAAKAGDVKAARDVVLTTARENKFFDLQKRFPDAILVPVRALERAGNNRLPGEFADYFGHVTGLRVDKEIVQNNQTGHTGSGSDYRMAHRPSFDGAVIPGQTYIIVDDVVTMGGTLGELRAHIESRGGKVGAITTLAAAQFSAQIALTPKTKLALETKFDQVALREWLQQNDIYGGEFGALTEAEGRWLLAAKTLDAAGDRIAAQRRQGDERGIAGVLRPSAPKAGPDVEFATSVNAYVAANDTPPDKIDAARTDIAQILGVVRDEQLELISYDGGSDLPRTNPAPAGSVGDTPAALQRAAAALKAPNQPDAVRAAYGIDPRDLNYAGSERISSIIPALVADPKRSWDIRGAQITTARDVMTLVTVMRSPYVETAKIILLNRDNVVVHSEIVGIGSVSAAIMDASQLGALLNRAPASKDGYNIIFSHNHPGGNPEPSKPDNALTRNLRAMLAKTKHTLVDHVITNGDTFYSYREQGLINFGHQPVTTTKPRARGKDADTAVEPGATAPWEIVRRGELLPATSSSVTLELLASLRQVDPTALHIIYLNIRNLVTALERVPNFQLPGDAHTEAELEPLTSKIFSGLGREGAKGFIILAPDTMKGGTAMRVMRHLKQFATDGNFYLLDYASSQLTQDSTAAAIGLLEPRSELSGSTVDETSPDLRTQIRQLDAHLASLENSQEDQADIERLGRRLTAEREKLRRQLETETRAERAAASIADVRHPAAVGTPEPGEAWMMVPRMTDAQLRQERMDVGQHLVDNYDPLGRAGRALLNARIDAIRAEEARRAPQPRRDAEGNALVDPIPKTSRRDALIAELKRGRDMAGEANRTGNDEALKEGTRLVRLAKERLDEEFPGWETAARPTTAQAPSAAPDATDTQPGAFSANNAAPPPPPAPPIAEAAQPDDAEPSPFTGENEPDMPIRPGKIAEVYGHSSYQPGVFVRVWRKVREVIMGIRGPVPELPTFPAAKWNADDSFIRSKGATFYNGIREFYRALKSGNDYIQRTAEEQVARITRPLIEAGGSFAANDYAKLQARQEKGRRLRAEGKPVPRGVIAEITALQSKMESNPYVLFNRLVFILDQKWRHENLDDSAGNPITLTASLNPAEVNAELNRLRQTIQAGPHTELIRTALDRHMQLVKDVASDLKARELMEAEQLANPYYFPHTVLEIERGGKIEQREITPTRVQAGTEIDFRGYLQKPVGSKKPIETDYVRAMYTHLVQVGAHNLKADAIANHARPYNIMKEVRERAAQLTKTRGRPVSWEQAFEEEYADQGYVRLKLDTIDAFPIVTVDHNKLAQRLGIALSGENLREQLERMGEKGVRLLPGDLGLDSMQGEAETWIVPARVAEALQGISRREKRTDNSAEVALKWPLQIWKRWKLYAPHHHFRYEFGNIIADMEKVFSATPGTFKKMPTAAREIREFWLGGVPSADLRAALKDGVVNAVTAQELGGLSQLKQFEEFETTTQKIWLEIKAIGSAPLSNATRLFGKNGLLGRISGGDQSSYREAVFRYANYIHNLERIRAGERPDYGGAYHRDIDAMQDTKPGAGDRAQRQAAQISKATFGDYGDISITGQWLRDKLLPFYSWMEINFRYHANLFRNLHDMVRANEVSVAAAAGKGTRAAASFAAGFGARAAGGFMLRLAVPYVAVALWNGGLGALAGAWDEGDDLEKELSEEDRRRFHIILGRTADGKVNVVYAPTALTDIMKWFSGARFAQQAGAYLNGKTDFPTALAEWRDNIVPDFLNNTVGSFGPYVKIPFTLASKKNSFPDVTDMRSIPAYDMRRVIIGQAADEFTADMIERILNKDYYASRDFGTWAMQMIGQVRQRDPEAYAFYAIKDKAAEFEYQMTGDRYEPGTKESKAAQAISSFRRAIYKGDIEAAAKFYQRLLGFGYTAEKFRESIRAQEPLHSLGKKDGMRRAFVESLTPADRELLDRAQRYYVRINSERGQERGLFPSERSGQAGVLRYQQNPQIDRLRTNMENIGRMEEDAIKLQAERALQNSLRNTR